MAADELIQESHKIAPLELQVADPAPRNIDGDPVREAVRSVLSFDPLTILLAIQLNYSSAYLPANVKSDSVDDTLAPAVDRSGLSLYMFHHEAYSRRRFSDGNASRLKDNAF